MLRAVPISLGLVDDLTLDCRKGDQHGINVLRIRP